jgi:hypothetical protein
MTDPITIDRPTALELAIQDPSFQIGQWVFTGRNPCSDWGQIIGLRLSRLCPSEGWDYLVKLDAGSFSAAWCEEDWCYETDIALLDGSPFHYRTNWIVKLKEWRSEFLFCVYDRRTEVEAVGLKLFASQQAAMLAGRAFVDREFPESAEELAARENGDL